MVLSRKVGEKILVGDDVAITVVRVAQGAVRIGVEAPDDMVIVREEIRAASKQADHEAAPDEDAPDRKKAAARS